MSKLLYTVTVQFLADATDTDKIAHTLAALAQAGNIVETKAKAITGRQFFILENELEAKV